MVSMASLQGELVGTVVTGLRRREAIVAPWNASLIEAERVRVSGDEGWFGVIGGVGGRRSFAASQSSSANYCIC